jgi:cytochrome c551/c552
MLRGGCFNCHQANTKLVGPPFRAVAAKYASDRDGAARVMEQIKNGGAGKWGPIPMPPASGFSPEETAVIARWILEQK